MIHKVPDVFIKRPKLICDLQHQQDVSLQQFKGHGWNNLQKYYIKPRAFFTISCLRKITKNRKSISGLHQGGKKELKKSTSLPCKFDVHSQWLIGALALTVGSWQGFLALLSFSRLIWKRQLDQNPKRLPCMQINAPLSQSSYTQ